MVINPTDFGRFSNINPHQSTFRHNGIKMIQGSQILGTPRNSIIENLKFGGGASRRSNWPTLRGAVLKFEKDRTALVKISGKGFTIPSACTLMDRGSLESTIIGRNAEKEIPFIEVKDISEEIFYMVPSSYCHPQEIFLTLGMFSKSEFKSGLSVKRPHLCLEGSTLFLLETELDRRVDEKPFNLIEKIDPGPVEIHVQLREGGILLLKNE